MTDLEMKDAWDLFAFSWRLADNHLRDYWFYVNGIELGDHLSLFYLYRR